MTSFVRPRVYLDVSIGVEPAGRLVVELFADMTPKTCENFRALCANTPPDPSYKLAPFHRIVDEFMVQGGDNTRGDGTGGRSAHGDDFPTENIGWRSIDKEGLLCMADRGNGLVGSQFYITLAPAPHLDAKASVFGQLVSGHSTLQRLSQLAVDAHDRPLEPATIAACGELERRKKAAATGPSRAHGEDTRGRAGRRRRSRSTSIERRAARALQEETLANGAAGTRKRPRRRSDHSIDENIRGRVRRRSLGPSREASPIEEEEGESPRRKGRARSREPSRSPRRRGGENEDEEYGRRRPSLPNQYGRWKQHDRHGHGRVDEERLRLEEWERDGGDGRYEGTMQSDGRLGGGGFEHGGGSGVIYKGRGSMKFREKKQY